jgi:hypothetical protein
MGYQGVACEIKCEPTDAFHYQHPLGDRFVCDCKEGWLGAKCDKQDFARQIFYANETLLKSTAAPYRGRSVGFTREVISLAVGICLMSQL